MEVIGRLLPGLSVPADGGNCTRSFTQIHNWSIHSLQIAFSIASLMLNSVVTVVTHRAAPIPYPQRRQFAAVSINFAFLAGIQLARNIFLLLSIYKPCLVQSNSAACKLQEFPLLFCYIHAGILVCILSSRTHHDYKEPKKPIPYAWLCSAWQTLLAVVCIAITLLFTAFDEDVSARPMQQCSVLLALRDTDKVFILLTFLILLHAVAVGTILLRIGRRVPEYDRKNLVTYCIRNVINIETVLWQTSFLFSGSLVLYRFIANSSCEECIRVCLELCFVSIPLLTSFLHPILLIWYVYPIRDAMVRVFPWTGSIVPEYALVPPPPAKPLKRRSLRNAIRRQKLLPSIEEKQKPQPAAV